MTVTSLFEAGIDNCKPVRIKAFAEHRPAFQIPVYRRRTCNP